MDDEIDPNVRNFRRATIREKITGVLVAYFILPAVVLFAVYSCVGYALL